MKTVKTRLLPFFVILACCAVVAAFVSQANAKDWDEKEEWEAQVFEVKVMTMHLEMYDQMLSVMGGMHEIADDKSATAVMAVMSVEDNLKPDEAIEFLEGIIDDVDDDTTQRMIRIKLIEFYKKEGNHEAAMEHVEALIMGE